MQSTECNDRCSNVLLASIESGDKGAVSIKSSFIPGSSYSFSVEIDFGRSYIGKFSVSVTINPTVGQKFFGTVGTSESLKVDVNPAFLAKAEGKQ